MILKTATISDIRPKAEGALRALFLGDVHLLHRRTPTQVIVDNLRDKLTAAILYNVDVVYITGDLWDDSRHLRQDDTQIALEFLSDLVSMAKVFDFGLRVLEGTPSHDHGQSKIIRTINRTVNADVVYLDGIGIYNDPRLDMAVGYVQDEYNTSAIETEKEMREIMKTHGLKKVGFFVMHGCFTFQLPVFKAESFNEKFWVPRCTYGIFIGHDHRPKTCGLIRVTGSFDRLSHNEEEDKGITIVDFSGGITTGYFLVNELAVPYLTVREQPTDDMLYAECIKALGAMDAHPNGEHGRLRIQHAHNSNIVESIRKWAKEFPFIITGDKLADPTKEKELQLAFEPDEEEEAIDKTNLASLIFEELGDTKFDRELASEILQEVA